MSAVEWWAPTSAREEERVNRHCLLAIANAAHGRPMTRACCDRSELWLQSARIDIWSDTDPKGKPISLERFFTLLHSHSAPRMNFRLHHTPTGQVRFEISNACALDGAVHNIEVTLPSFD